jgi:hypothetical protein
MAKTAVKAPEVETVVKLSASTTKAIDGIRGQFDAYLVDFTGFAKSRTELAPRFMRAFGMWQAETGGTFISFVRLLHPEIPADREGYRNHAIYQAATYLQRVVVGTTAGHEASVEASPNEAFARLVAAFLPMVSPSAIETFWQALHETLKWSEAHVERVKVKVEAAEPLVTVSKQKGPGGMLKVETVSSAAKTRAA